MKWELFSKLQLLTILILLVVSPVFGVVLADLVGYHEPLDLVAETLNLKDVSEELNWTPFYDYTVPGVDPIVGYFLSGVVGVVIILGTGYLLVWRKSGSKT